MVELAVVLVIVAILMSIGLASYFAMANTADGKGTQLDLVTATKVQALHHLEQDAFTDDAGVLVALEPTLQYSAAGDPAGSIVVEIEPGRETLDVCLFARTPQGDWFSVRHSTTDGDRYAQSAPVACTPDETDGWSTESW